MPTVTLKIKGDKGEKEVVELVSCPNCGRDLMLLPASFPLHDVQCTGCHFRAQIKTIASKPTNTLRGAGWNPMNNILRAGHLVPSLIVHFTWKEKGKRCRDIRFYPFIQKNRLNRYIADIRSANRRHPMFGYNLKDLPYITLYKS